MLLEVTPVLYILALPAGSAPDSGSINKSRLPDLQVSDQGKSISPGIYKLSTMAT